MKRYRTASKARLLALCALGACLAACTTVPFERSTAPPAPAEHRVTQVERIGEAAQALADLGEIDVLVRLENGLLGTDIRDGIIALLDEVTVLESPDVELRFHDQYIALDVTADYRHEDESIPGVVLHGDVALLFQAGRLLWQPRFHALTLPPGPLPTDETEGEAGAPAPIGDAAGSASRLLIEIDSELTRRVLGSSVNVIELEPVPLAILEAGARLDGPTGGIASEAFELDGVFTTAGVAILIEPDVTSLALDLDFVPSVSSCEGDVEITRAAFAQEIRNREPVGLSPLVNPDADVRYFFTEVTGAREPTTVIHYWFADGEPASVVKLDVDPSARWRTWSARPEEPAAARNWEVIVVEQSSGCILSSLALMTQPPREAGPRGVELLSEEPPVAPPSDAEQGFVNYREEFSGRVADFPGMAAAPVVASVDVRRAFFREALSSVLYDVRLAVRFGLDDASARSHAAVLGPIRPEEVRCSGQECEVRRECTVNYDNCPLERDTRDCVSCLFRNPLNNRCMREAEDPICEAARAARNARLEREREACVENEQRARDACERLRRQELESCRMQSEIQRGACEARRGELERMAQQAAPLAEIRGRARGSGELSVLFSGFRIEGDLERVEMDIGLSADADVTGSLAFSPAAGLQEVSNCIGGWSGDFSSRAVLPLWQGRLVSPLVRTGDAMEAAWSGFTHRLGLRPSPLESLFVTQPQLLAACQLGLSVGPVAEAVTGADADFFRGEWEVAIQPLPTRLVLLPAYLRYADRAYGGEPQLGDRYLSFPFSQ